MCSRKKGQLEDPPSGRNVKGFLEGVWKQQKGKADDNVPKTWKKRKPKISTEK